MSFKQTTPQRLVYVTTPRSSYFDSVYAQGIAPACQDAGCLCERIPGEPPIDLDIVYARIGKADAIVADISTSSPRVLYEVGYAHALGKPVVLLTSAVETTPFDLTQYPSVRYGEPIAAMRDQLSTRLATLLREPNPSIKLPRSDLRAWYDGRELVPGSKFDLYGHSDRMFRYELRMDVHHAALDCIEPLQCQIALQVPRKYVGGGCKGEPENSDPTSVALSVTERLHIQKPIFRIFPGGWQSVAFWFISKEGFHEDQELSFALRVASDLGPALFPFVLRMKGIDSLPI